MSRSPPGGRVSAAGAAEFANPEARRFGRVLVGYDGSKGASKALEVAESIAVSNGSELVVLEVPQLPVYLLEGGPGIPLELEEYFSSTEEKAEAEVDRVVKRLKADGVNARGEVLGQATSPAQAIIKCAEEEGADLIVVGTRGLGRFKKLLLGSVSSALVSHAPCSVLVVR